MKRLMLGMAAVSLGLAVAGSVQAGNRGSGQSSRSSSTHSGTSHSQGSTGRLTNFHDNRSNYHWTNAKKFEHGYYYPGKNHNHWSYRCWDKRYGCYLYYDPGLCCYYYYCVPDSCYYPVSYCPYQRYGYDTPVSYNAPASGLSTAIAVATASAGTNASPPGPPAPVR
jgi:hypothetical protein